MSDSSQAPLLRSRSRSRSRSRRNSENSLYTGSDCLFDQIVNIFRSLLSTRNLAVVSGPIATIIVFVVAKYNDFGEEAAASAGVVNKIGPMLGALVWMGLWWLLEPVPIAVTALLPLAIFPFFEIMDAEAVSSEYMDDIIALLLGTFIIALAVEKYSLHKRLALKLVLVTGEKMDPRLLLLAFLAGSVFVSMWIANASASAMMLPMATGVLKNFKLERLVSQTKSSVAVHSERTEEELDTEENEEVSDYDQEDAKAAIKIFAQGVILAVTYGVGLGGMGTLIASGSTLLLPGLYQEMFPDAPEITFLPFMEFALAVVIPWAFLLWIFLCWRYSPRKVVPVLESCMNRDTIQKDYESLGPITFPEVFISVEFGLLVLLWATRTLGTTAGWADIFDKYPGDGSIAIAAAILLFLVPNFRNEGEMLMDWKSCKDITWSVILVLGGGFALSTGIQESGLSTWLGTKMEILEYVPYYLLTPMVGLIIGFITEFTANAACANLFLPILGQVAVKTLNRHPLLLMLPATFASQYAFILPSGTPPTAMAFGTGYINVKDMGSPGLFMHVIGIIILSIVTPTLGAYMFGLDQSASSLSWI